jgi:hypothetical protein
MTVVLLDGRKLPHQDWEGDDFTPGAGGHYVTCTDTSLGRDIAYATNGRVDKDGRVYRAALVPHDPNGISLPQAKQAAKTVAGVNLILPVGWHWAEVMAHLRAKKGLIIQGWYAEIPRMYRYQLSSDFGHAMFVSHYSPTSGMRVWDALDPNLTHHGQWVPAIYVRNFLEALQHRFGASSLLVAYAPLVPLQ